MYPAASAFCLPAPVLFCCIQQMSSIKSRGCSPRVFGLADFVRRWDGHDEFKHGVMAKRQLVDNKQPKNRFSFICGVSPISPQMDGTSGALKKTEVRPTDRPDVSRLPPLTDLNFCNRALCRPSGVATSPGFGVVQKDKT